jgi:hypothetical protein
MRGQTVWWRVQVVERSGAPVAGATVVTSTAINGATISNDTGTTGNDGWALFSRVTTKNDARGTYTIQVASVSRSAATYDAAANVKSSTTYTLK